MQRFPSMKIGLASFLSCLALVLGLYTTTGTASAHSAIHPFINVVSSLQREGNCVSFELEGGDFTPNLHVDLFASASGGASIDPDRVRANGNGRFLVDVTACENQQFENCGNFINSLSFCGFNLPQNDFCGLNGFSGVCPFIGSAMKALPCPPMDPMCQQGQGQGNPCRSPNPPSFCQQGQGQGQGNPCQSPNPPSFCQGGQGNGGGNFCQQHPDQCNQNHHRFRFPRVPLFNFCNFNRQGRFPFCFRFFPRQFPISIGITAVDEHTGRRAHVGIGIG